MTAAPIDTWLANRADRGVYCGMGDVTRFRVTFHEGGKVVAYGYGETIGEAFADGLNDLMRRFGAEEDAA